MEERQAPGHKSSKERLTAMCCANADGTHKVKLCVIGKAKRPRSFKGTDVLNLPVDYFNQKGAWMDRAIFKEWFDKKFVPQVKTHLQSLGLPQKAVLLLDNAPSHPPELTLKSSDGQIFVKYLPPNVTALIQPMDQGVIATMKRHYRSGLLQIVSDEHSDLKTFWKNLTLLDAIYELEKAWGKVRSTTLQKSWKKIFRYDEDQNEDIDSDDDDAEFNIPLAELRSILRAQNRCKDVDIQNIEEWLHIDESLPGYITLTEEDIVNRICDNVEEGGSSDNNSYGDLVIENRIPHSRALEHVQGLLEYLEQQGNEFLPIKLALHNLRADIRCKANRNTKQSTINDYFGKD